MFGRHRRSNPVFLLFRLILSLFMFGVLLFGGYSAYKHFSGVDPLKLDPQAVISDAFSKLGMLSGVKLPTMPAKIIPSQTKEDQTTANPSALFKFLVVADSHSDNKNLAKAISQAKKGSNLSFIIGLGDYTEVGTLAELGTAKKVFDEPSLRYFLVAGDHDQWDSRDKQLDPKNNFRQVFGPSYQSFVYNNYLFLLLDNSDNYKGISTDQSAWITNELEKAKQDKLKGILVFLHEPLYHPSSDHAMGKVEKSLKLQAESLIFELKKAEIKAVFAGDTHYFSQYEEPVTKISMYTIGAVVTQRNPQLPRYAIISIMDNGGISVEDVEIR